MSATLNGFQLTDIDTAIDHIDERLLRLSGARLFITGGTGFIGQWLLALLVRGRQRLGLDYHVEVLSRDGAGFAARCPDFGRLDWLRIHTGDIRTFNFPDGAFSHVIHAATDTSAAADSRPAELAASIIDGATRVLRFCQTAGVRRCLYLSSGAIYGRQPADMDMMTEDYCGDLDPIAPGSVYGESKRAAEMLCAIAARGDSVETVMARIFAIVGPGLPLDGHFAVGNFIRDAIAEREIVISGDGTPLRSYLYAADLAAWLVALLVDGKRGAAYNVGSDEACSIHRIAERTRAALGSKSPILVRGAPRPDAPRSRYIPSISRARGELGLGVWTPLETAIRHTADHARATSRENA